MTKGIRNAMKPPELERIRETLINGLRLSKQGSYSRRAPAAEALPYLREACSALTHFLQKHPANADAWKLLALGYEAQLDYSRSVHALQNYFELAPNASKDDYKRLDRCRQYLQEWNSLGLTPDALEELGKHLRSANKTEPGRDFKHTMTWVRETGHDDPEAVLQGLRDWGTFDDWQVLQNVIVG